MKIKELGYKESMGKLTKSEQENKLQIARICTVQKEAYRIVGEFGENLARLKSSIFYKDADSVRYPAVGDFVVVFHQEQGEDIIYRILPRYTVFIRKNPSIKAIRFEIEQVVAANFDYVFLMMSLNQDFNLQRLQRYLVIAKESGAELVIVLTKADLVEELELQEYIRKIKEIAPSIPTYAISVYTNYGMEALTPYFSAKKTIVLLGSSGIGKSSFINACTQKEDIKVNTIREKDGKGRHTTTYRELIPLANGGFIIDTPGMRAIGLMNVEEGVKNIFSDIEELIENCRFSNCNHQTEPGCAVKEALENGSLSQERFKSYQKLKKEAERTKRLETILSQKLSNTKNKNMKNKKDIKHKNKKNQEENNII